VEPFKGQKYSVLKKQALSSGRSFQDPEFQPNEESLFYGRGRSTGIEWKRPRVSSLQCLASEKVKVRKTLHCAVKYSSVVTKLIDRYLCGEKCRWTYLTFDMTVKELVRSIIHREP